MAMRFQSGTPEMCMDMDPADWSECFPVSSMVKPSLADPTLVVSVCSTMMISETMTEQI